ncbi:MAG: hypothetical protein II685_04805 [Clostridia bacterium]|nr:hypothetical protein [Clostridia bacterium]
MAKGDIVDLLAIEFYIFDNSSPGRMVWIYVFFDFDGKGRVKITTKNKEPDHDRSIYQPQLTGQKHSGAAAGLS